MRKLFYVPIIHGPADMGSMAIALSETSAAALGRDIWDEHQKIVSLFWDSISRFFSSLPASNIKIFQDGLVAAGEEGLVIIDAGVRLGSVNYKIISGLLGRGAVLIKTEDIALVKREYNYIKKLTLAKTTRERETAALRYNLARGKLLEDRDSYIAGTIESTLKDGDTGVLFIGAYHEVLSKLPADIRIVQIKEVTKVREYHRIFASAGVKPPTQSTKLAEYLVSPVSGVAIN